MEKITPRTVSLGRLCYLHGINVSEQYSRFQMNGKTRGHGADTGFFVYILHNCEAHAYHTSYALHRRTYV